MKRLFQRLFHGINYALMVIAVPVLWLTKIRVDNRLFASHGILYVYSINISIECTWSHAGGDISAGLALWPYLFFYRVLRTHSFFAMNLVLCVHHQYLCACLKVNPANFFRPAFRFWIYFVYWRSCSVVCFQGNHVMDVANVSPGSPLPQCLLVVALALAVTGPGYGRGEGLQGKYLPAYCIFLLSLIFING